MGAVFFASFLAALVLLAFCGCFLLVSIIRSVETQSAVKKRYTKEKLNGRGVKKKKREKQKEKKRKSSPNSNNYDMIYTSWFIGFPTSMWKNGNSVNLKYAARQHLVLFSSFFFLFPFSFCFLSLFFLFFSFISFSSSSSSHFFMPLFPHSLSSFRMYK